LALTAPDETLLDLFAEQVAASRYRTALRHEAGGVFRSISWELWDAESDRIAAALVRLGVAQGQAIAIVSNTRVEWAIADVGILKAGGVTVPIYPSLPGVDVRAILANSGAKIAIVEDEEQRAKLEGSDVEHVFLIDDEGDAGWGALLVSGDEALAEGAGDELAARREAVTPEDLATIVYTSGTMGEPKGVELTHGAFVFQVDAVGSVFAVGVTDLQLLFLPLSHIFARMTLFLQMRIGFTTALSKNLEGVAQDFSRIRPTFVIGVPRLYEKIHEVAKNSAADTGDLGRRVFDWAVDVRKDGKKGLLSNVKRKYADRLVFERMRQSLGGRIRFMVSGAAPLAKETAEFFFAAGLPLLTGYGLTETAGAATANLLNSYKIGTVGRPLPGVNVAIAEDGEILIKGHNVMRRYHGSEEATRRAFDAHGWFKTGDLGNLDADGFLTITGRKKDLLITAGGKTIAPRKLEAILEESPYIQHAVVIADRRPYAVALLSLAPEPTRKWAREQGVSGDFLTLIGHPSIHELVSGIIDELNTDLASYETIKRWTILDRGLSQDAGELTPTHKIRRRAVEKAFRREIRELYR
jgi:long-chain acyl-CoA synthetase